MTSIPISDRDKRRIEVAVKQIAPIAGELMAAAEAAGLDCVIACHMPANDHKNCLTMVIRDDDMSDEMRDHVLRVVCPESSALSLPNQRIN